MTLRTKVNRIEGKARLNRKTKSRAIFFMQFLDALGRSMVLCIDGKERPVEEWVKLKGIDQQLAEIEQG